MGKTTEAVGRFVLTWFAFYIMAILYSGLYPMLIIYSTYIMIVLPLAAIGVGIHAAVRGVPRVDRSYKLLVAAIPSWYPLARISLYGPYPEFPTVFAGYAFWTVLASLSFGSAYVIVYRLRLLDRNGPVGRAVGLD